MWRAAARAVMKVLRPADVHRRHVVINVHLGERDPVRVRVGDQVERDVDASCLLCDGVRMPVNGLLVERIDDRRFCISSRRANVVGYRLELGRLATGEEDPCSFASERSGNRAADRPARSVDHSVLVFEQHAYLLNSDVSPCRPDYGPELTGLRSLSVERLELAARRELRGRDFDAAHWKADARAFRATAVALAARAIREGGCFDPAPASNRWCGAN
jgi:hypothetical protein